MRKFKDTFFEDVEEYFDEYISSFEMKLRETSKEYNNYCEESENILTEYPNLRKVYDDCECISLNELEVKNLITVFTNDLQKRFFEYKEVFIKGMQEEFYLLKKLKLIKDKEEN